MPREDAATRRRILIIDDEESTRLLLARMVGTGLGVDIQLAGTCEQALRFAESTVYDAILLDLLMPGIGGWGVLAELRRAGAANATTPIVIVTQVVEKQTLERCLAAGANACHVKPVRRAELLQTVQAQLAASAARTH